MVESVGGRRQEGGARKPSWKRRCLSAILQAGKCWLGEDEGQSRELELDPEGSEVPLGGWSGGVASEIHSLEGADCRVEGDEGPSRRSPGLWQESREREPLFESEACSSPRPAGCGVDHLKSVPEGGGREDSHVPLRPRFSPPPPHPPSSALPAQPASWSPRQQMEGTQGVPRGVDRRSAQQRPVQKAWAARSPRPRPLLLPGVWGALTTGTGSPCGQSRIFPTSLVSAGWPEMLL